MLGKGGEEEMGISSDEDSKEPMQLFAEAPEYNDESW